MNTVFTRAQFEVAVKRESEIRTHTEPLYTKIHAQYMKGLLTTEEYANEVMCAYLVTAQEVDAEIDAPAMREIPADVAQDMAEVFRGHRVVCDEIAREWAVMLEES